MTLVNLNYGSHNFTLFAIDMAGNIGSSEMIVFAMSKAKPFPTLLVVAVVAVVVVAVIAGLLVYFKKRKR